MNPFEWDTLRTQLSRPDDRLLAEFNAPAVLHQHALPVAPRTADVRARDDILCLVLDVAASIVGARFRHLPS